MTELPRLILLLQMAASIKAHIFIGQRISVSSVATEGTRSSHFSPLDGKMPRLCPDFPEPASTRVDAKQACQRRVSRGGRGPLLHRAGPWPRRRWREVVTPACDCAVGYWPPEPCLRSAKGSREGPRPLPSFSSPSRAPGGRAVAHPSSGLARLGGGPGDALGAIEKRGQRVAFELAPVVRVEGHFGRALRAEHNREGR